MPKMKLTKGSIDRVAKPGLTTCDALYWDTESKGFGLRVTPTGLAKFIAQGRVRGTNREVRTTIGSYGAWTVDDARRRAEEIRHQFEDGKDPRDQWRQSESEQVTLRQVADLYQARQGKMRESTKAEMDRHVDKVFAAWRDKPMRAARYAGSGSIWTTTPPSAGGTCRTRRMATRCGCHCPRRLRRCCGRAPVRSSLMGRTTRTCSHRTALVVT